MFFFSFAFLFFDNLGFKGGSGPLSPCNFNNLPFLANPRGLRAFAVESNLDNVGRKERAKGGGGGRGGWSSLLYLQFLLNLLLFWYSGWQGDLLG